MQQNIVRIILIMKESKLALKQEESISEIINKFLVIFDK